MIYVVLILFFLLSLPYSIVIAIVTDWSFVLAYFFALELLPTFALVNIKVSKLFMTAEM